MRELERVERVFAEQRLPCTPELRGQALELALETLADFHDPGEARQAASLTFASSLLVAHAEELAARPLITRELAKRLQALLGLSAESLAGRLLAPLGMAFGTPAETVATVLGLLSGLLPLSGASLWRLDRAGAPQCVDDVGTGVRSPAARRLARRLLQGEQAPIGPRAELFGLTLEEPSRPVGVLIARCGPNDRGTVRAGLRGVLEVLAGAIVRDALMARNAGEERALLEGGERRLMRLGFDLHDGPMQELLMLGEDLRMFREQLTAALGAEPRHRLLRGRLDDLDARLVALEGGLRRISTSLHASVMVDRPFAQALAEILDAFAARSGVTPLLRLDGSPEEITASQRIALLSVVGEALNNVREHGGAVNEVRVEIDCGPQGVGARVLDDGAGFDVEAALLSAARRGRMGLAGIHERVRLLGGQCILESRPGGPTSVSLSLPRWEPLAAGAQNAAAR